MKANLFSISMFNSVSLGEGKALEQLLETFNKSEAFVPTDWSNNEGIYVEYNPEQLIKQVDEHRENISSIYLRGRKNVRFKGKLITEQSKSSFLNFDFEKNMPRKYWNTLFYLSDKIAEVVKPRFGVTHILWPSAIPWKNHRERIHMWMNLCAQFTPVKLVNHGPVGVGLRTYFGGDIMELFNRDFLLKTPAKVYELSWGGICIDLVDKPWEAELGEILDSWIKVMKYLGTARVFAIPSFDEDCKGISFRENETWKNSKEKFIDNFINL